jgi:hypothetical protein
VMQLHAVAEALACAVGAIVVWVLLAAVFFLFDYQQFRKYFKNILEKVCVIKIKLYICNVIKNKQNGSKKSTLKNKH